MILGYSLFGEVPAAKWYTNSALTCSELERNYFSDSHSHANTRRAGRTSATLQNMGVILLFQGEWLMGAPIWEYTLSEGQASASVQGHFEKWCKPYFEWESVHSLIFYTYAETCF